MLVKFDGTELDLPVSDNSYRYRAIKGEHALTLYCSLPEHIEIPLGAWCEFQGERYTLERPGNIKKHGMRNFEYTLVLEAAQSGLSRYKFRDTVTHKLKFSLTAKPREHLEMLVGNLNDRETGWSAGTCIDAVEKVISYNHAFCSDALSQIAEAFETEWEIVGKTINLCKVEYNRDNPLALSYGRGNGFKSGVGRSNGDKKPVEILFVQGGERNIDASNYPDDGSGIKSRELLLPKSQAIGYDGEHFSDQMEFDSSKARQYVTDADGFSIRRSDKPLTSQAEDSLDCSHTYPSRVGAVSAVEVVDEENHFYDFIDNSIPENLDFSQYRIDGEIMTVIFQSGILAGKEFELEQSDRAVTGYVHSDRRFKLKSQEIDGQTMPNDIFCPKIGDKYAVFGMMLPQAYICDDATKSGASWDMFREAAKYLYENGEQKFTFTGELDGIWAKKDWLNIGGKIKLGGYVLFTDNQFQPEGIPIRIVGIRDYINNPHSPTIELSNEIVAGSIADDLRRIETNEVLADDSYRSVVQFTRRRFRDAQETSKMLEAALLDNFTNSISPISVKTMQLLAGDESLQFQFVDRIPADDNDMPQRIIHNVTYGTDRVLHSVFQDREQGVLQHMTIGIMDMKSTHLPMEYSHWRLPEYNSPPLDEPRESYYLYARCSKSEAVGKFILSKSSINIEAEDGYYHFLVAMVSGEYEGERSVVTLYGFSEILPGRITTDRIVSSDGQNFIDLANNAFRAGNQSRSIDWNITVKNTLTLLNVAIRIGVSANSTGIQLNPDGSGSLGNGSVEWNNNAADFLFRIAGWLFKNNRLESVSGKTFLDGQNGQASFADGKILLNEDGSGRLANGSVSWDTGGNVSLSNVTANSGTFKGTINANGGIQMGVCTVNSTATLSASDSFVLVQSSVASHGTTVNLPSSPNTGQLLTIFNNTYNEILILGNGKAIKPQQDDSNDELAYLGSTRAKQFIFSGTSWFAVGMYDF